MKFWWKIWFAVVVAGDLLGRWLMSDTLNYLFKPLIVPSLIFYFFRFREKNAQAPYVAKVLLAALVCSWLGDIFLLFTGETMFMAGLAFFLLAHIFYIFLFLKTATKPTFLSQKPWWAVPIVAFAAAMFAYLYPYLHDFTIPVGIYCIALGSMVLAALNRKGCVDGNSFAWVFGGAILFMISDSILAVNKFAQPLPYAEILIMFTYIAAQFSIVQGFLHKKTPAR
ncbi:MAG: lysoplasmalogenase [Chitinophagales bacterium]|nr:lysoplasmalogenase [Bacteroidota bacterium]